jgi:glycosyltransferase involved in cell wall biosynthesis
MKVLHIIPNLDFENAAKQLTLLVPALNASGIQCRIAVLSGIGPFINRLQEANIPPDLLGWNRLFDIRPLLRLKELIKSFSPNVIHCWRVETVRFLALAGGRNNGALVMASFLGKHSRSFLGKLESKLLSRIDKVVFQWPREFEDWRSCLPLERMCLIHPGVAAAPPSLQIEIPDSIKSLPREARVILCVGPMEPSRGIKEAIWAFHILGNVFPDLHLMVIGEGSERQRLVRLASNILAERVIFAGSTLNLNVYLDRANVVWIPSLEARGLNVALEAMAAGKPIVASRLAGLTDIIGNDEAGLLVAPGDKVGLARTTRPLLDDPNKMLQLGEAGQRRVVERFSVSSMARAFHSIYQSALKSE